LRKNRAINSKIDLAAKLLKIGRKILGKSRIQSSKKQNSFFVQPPEVARSNPTGANVKRSYFFLHGPRHQMSGRQRRNDSDVVFESFLEMLNIEDIREFTA
jgi:hypothetical protein